jgi:hypothetical protein
MFQADGSRLRDHLESVERQTGKRPAQLDGPDLPDQGAHLWGWFADLSRGRQMGGMGPSRLTYADMQAWIALMGVAVEPWEIRALLRIDSAWLVCQAENKPKGNGGAA